MLSPKSGQTQRCECCTLLQIRYNCNTHLKLKYKKRQDGPYSLRNCYHRDTPHRHTHIPNDCQYYFPVWLSRQSLQALKLINSILGAKSSQVEELFTSSSCHSLHRCDLHTAPPLDMGKAAY